MFRVSSQRCMRRIQPCLAIVDLPALVTKHPLADRPHGDSLYGKHCRMFKFLVLGAEWDTLIAFSLPLVPGALLCPPVVFQECEKPDEFTEELKGRFSSQVRSFICLQCFFLYYKSSCFHRLHSLHTCSDEKMRSIRSAKCHPLFIYFGVI